MKKYVLLLGFITLAYASFGQKWQHIGSGAMAFPNGTPANLSIERLTALNVTTIFGYGLNTFVVSTDAGSTWDVVSVPLTRFHIRNVHFFDQNTGIASGDSLPPSGPFVYGLLLKTTDGGQTWNQVHLPSPVHLEQITSISFKNINDFVIGTYAIMYITKDGGNSWTKTSNAGNMGPAFDAINYSGDSSIFFRDYEQNRLYFSKNQGKNWTYKSYTQQLPGDPPENINFYKTYFEPTRNRGFIISKPSSSLSQTGGMYFSDNGGENWYPQSGFYDYDETEFSFSDAANGWMAGGGKKIYRFNRVNDTTISWTLDTAGLNNPTDTFLTASFAKLAMVSQNFGYLVVKTSSKYHVYRYGTIPTGPNTVSGKVFIDNNNNNQFDTLVDYPLPNITVAIPQSPLFTTTDINGNYSYQLGGGTYTLKVLKPSGYQNTFSFGSPSAGEAIINLSAGQTVTQNFSFKSAGVYPWLSVSVSTGVRRRCFAGQTIITYENNSLIPALNASVRLVMPQYVVLQSADKSYTVDANGHYIFNLGTVNGLEAGSIKIKDSIICGNEGIRGRTVCTEAYISADNEQYKNDTIAWDSTELTVIARCLNGWVNFQVINSTGFSMSDSVQIRFYSDAVLKDKRKVKVGANQAANFTFKADFSTWRAEVDQHSGHPLSKYAQATMEGCEGEGTGNVSTGFVNKLPVNDFRFKKNVYCDEIADSYDPNDKTVYPKGIGANNYVKPGTPLTYRVRFQNTGNAPAVKVVVKDTLSNDLDLSTFNFGGASHNYTYKITGQGKAVLEVIFDNINLPDSTTDKAGSNGFFTYSVEHKGGIAQGTRVDNDAYIYFDFNSPIKTNMASVVIKDSVPMVIDPIDPETNLPFIIKGYSKDTVCKGDTIKLIIVGEGPYKWTKQGSSVSLGTGFELEMIMDTTTTFAGYTADGSASFMVLVKDCSTGPNAVNEIGSAGIDVYPNPSADGVFTITRTEGIKTIRIIDITGRNAGTASGNTIQLSNPAPGVYFAIITTEDGNTYYKKLVKE